ncbi:vWA domain-containing protein [Bacillus methanolicus]|uniref:vWA domain-containing protein n=1 Tax=Bacillus methanolicus TaxID=1471 RepID=UPI0024B08D11|nr:vWA domain-containing protein [Bacillus methanolicus]
MIVKPKTGNAEGSLNIHLTPKGKATNADRKPIDVVFIFDKSGSMNELGKNPKKFQSAKDAMTEAINFFYENAGPNDRFAFIPFSSDVENDQVVYFSPNNGKESLSKINETVSKLSASGGTNYTQSFEKALEILEGGNNNKYIIFMTDGEPTFSTVKEKMTYKKKVQVGTEKKCFLFFCWEEPVYEYKTVTEDIDVHYELYGQGSKMTSKVYYYLNGEQYYKNMSVKDTLAAIRQHGLTMAEKLAEKNIKLYSIGFGNAIPLKK